MKKYIFAFLIFGAAIVLAEAASYNAYVNLKKENNGLFVLTMRDPQGIQKFSLDAPNKFPYGGTISGCPKSHIIDNVTFENPVDFTPFMFAYIIDCQQNKEEFKIFPLKNGVTTGERIIAEEPKPPEEEQKKAEESAKEEAAPKTKTTEQPAAQSVASKKQIKYPIEELGNCANESACKNYCDKSSNVEACLDFAKKNGLMSDSEIEKAQKFLDAGSGPGGCKTKDSCESYCDSVGHIDECVVFAEKNGLMAPQELEEAKKVQAAKARGVKMPACGSKKQCDAYCSEPDHMEECITFAQEAGFMSSQELEESKKVLAAIKAGAKPPPCRGKEECDAYCTEESHFDDCFDFALAAGMIDPKDAEMARKTKGKGPGGCRGKEQCDAFCQQEGNMEICSQFAYENGMMTQEEFEMFKKTKGKGPGGCKSKEECESFCNNPDNQETCFNFAKENGLIPEDDLKRMEEGKQQFKEAMQSIPPEVYSCLESAVGSETMAKFKSGEAMPPKEMGDKMQVCFEQNMKPREPSAPGEGGSMPPGGGVPGNFTPGNPPAGTGPGGCASPEECQNYCQTNPEDCRDFQPGAAPPQMPGGFQPSQPGQQPVRCAGENCPPPPYGPGTAPGSAPGPMMPCEGPNCPPPAGPGQMAPIEGMMPGAPIPSTEGGAPPIYQPPPSGESTAPGSGGEMQPGVFVPQFEPVPFIEQQTPPAVPAPAPEPAPVPSSEPPPQSSNYNSQNLLGIILNPFIEFLFGN